MSKLFTQTVAEINGGKFNEELTEAMGELVGSCSRTGRKGELVVKIKLQPHSSGAMQINTTYDLKAPDFERPADLFFPTASNDLVRNNPRQPELPLRPVEPQSGPIREVVDTKTGEILPVGVTA